MVESIFFPLDMFGFGSKPSSAGAPSLDSLIADNRCVMFSMPSCPWCVKAEELLHKRKLKCKTIDLGTSQYLAFEVIKATGQRSVPNIFMDGVHVGGYDNLAELADKRCSKKSEEPVCNFFNGRRRE